jgi:hypothetical protein
MTTSAARLGDDVVQHLLSAYRVHARGYLHMRCVGTGCIPCLCWLLLLLLLLHVVQKCSPCCCCCRLGSLLQPPLHRISSLNGATQKCCGTLAGQMMLRCSRGPGAALLESCMLQAGSVLPAGYRHAVVSGINLRQPCLKAFVFAVQKAVCAAA